MEKNKSVSPPQWISEDEIRRVLSWQALVPCVSDALVAVTLPSKTTLQNSEDKQHSATKDEEMMAVQPLRTRLDDPHHNGTLLVMPGLCRVKSSKGYTTALATKLLSLYPNNSARGLPSHSAVVLLMDPSTGQPLALLEGNCVTELRTAAASAAATRAVRAAKRQPTECAVVAILGAGVQAAAHARVLHWMMKPKEIRIWSRRGSTSDALARTLLAEGLPAVASASVEQCASGADVINTCTLATSPVLYKQWVTPGAHINSVGAARRASQELDPALVLDSEIFADSAEAALAEAGDIILSKATVRGEIGEVIQGKVTPTLGKTTIFKSLGLAVEDAVAARLVYDTIHPDAAGL